MCLACDIPAFITKLDKLIQSGRFTWCYDFLRDVQKTVMSTGHVSPKQIAAIEKIERKRR